MSDVIWFYTPSGAAALYQDGEYLWTPAGVCLYWEDGGWWFTMNGGRASHYLDDKWVFTADGQPAFYRA